MKVESESEVAQSSPTLCDPMDCSLPGSSIHGIFQARVLEWVTIAFSEIKQEVCIRRDDSIGLHREVTLNAMPGHLKFLVLYIL